MKSIAMVKPVNPLVKRLRRNSRVLLASGWGTGGDFAEAATEIETLERRLDEKNDALRKVHAEANAIAVESGRRLSEIARLKEVCRRAHGVLRDYVHAAGPADEDDQALLADLLSASLTK